MKLDGDVQERTSHMGTIMTILVNIAMCMFAYTKFTTILKSKDVDIMSAVSEFAITDDMKFTPA